MQLTDSIDKSFNESLKEEGHIIEKYAVRKLPHTQIEEPLIIDDVIIDADEAYKETHTIKAVIISIDNHETHICKIFYLYIQKGSIRK